MVEKYLNINLNDDNASDIAEIISSKTCKKILNLIAEQELSEGDIAKKLNLPINTVEYNLKKLIKAGLIDKSNNFFWSVKGKKIPTYKLANKKILISTKSKVSGILSSMLVFGAIGFAANVFRNIFNVSKNVYSSSSMNFNDVVREDYAGKVSEQVSSMGPSSASSIPNASDNATNLVYSGQGSFDFSSLFNDIGIWVLVGVVVGVVGFFVYKKFKTFVKGGLNKD